MTTTLPNETGAAHKQLEDGRVVAIAGPVVDVEFPPHSLPEINHLIEIPLTVDGVTSVVPAEVAQQIGEGRVRGSASSRPTGCRAVPSSTTWEGASPCPSVRRRSATSST